MRYGATISRFITAIFMASVFIAWNTSTKNPVTVSGGIFIYEFHEPLHCANTNYKITVTPSKIYLVIDKFTNILNKDSARLSVKQYNQFVKELVALNITTRERTAGPCVGSVSEYLELYAGSKQQIKGMYSACSPGFSSLAGDIPAAARLFTALVPDLEKKVDTIREQESGDDPCSP